MKWTVTLVAETEPGHVREQPLAQIEREDTITPASLGLSIAEGKTIVAAIQTEMVTAQVERHGQSLRPCPHCACPRTTKGYYTSIFRSVYGQVPMRVRRLRTCPCEETSRASASVLATAHRPIAPELLYVMAKLAALMPFGKVAAFLDEVLPTSTKTHASTVRNRTLRVGQRLERHQDTLPTAIPRAPAGEVVLGLDGGYVRNRQPGPERTFEIVAGKVLSGQDQTTRFAFVREGSAGGGDTIARLLRQRGTHAETRVTVLSDGDAGLRAIQRVAAPTAEHVLDWFHIAMRWQHIHQLATGLAHHGESAEARAWLLDRIDRAKWALWNGQLLKTFGHLADLRAWTWTVRADPSWLSQLRTHLCELTHYLDANADSLPNYGARHRQGAAISTAFVESAVNEIVSRRMVKKQQMRWNRETVQPFLTVRVHVLNDTLEDAFRHWHRAFRPVANTEPVLAGRAA
jgi:hypothetical protein